MGRTGRILIMKPGPLFLALSITACGGENTDSGWAVAADRVDGVVRVVNSPPEAVPLPTLVAEEELRIGMFEGGGPSSFGMIRSIAVLPDGRLAVADGQPEEVRLFARDGEHLRTFGGKGGGPGELEGMQGVHVDHEGMLRVAEYRNARLSVFHPDTGYVTSHPLRLYTYGARGPWGAVMDSSGRTVVASSGQYGEGRFWNMLRVYDAAMIQLDSIPYHEYTGVIHEDQPGAWRVNIGNGGFTWAPVPFYSRSYQVLASTGELWSSAEGRPQLEVARWTPPEDT